MRQTICGIFAYCIVFTYCIEVEPSFTGKKQTTEANYASYIISSWAFNLLQTI